MTLSNSIVTPELAESRTPAHWECPCGKEPPRRRHGATPVVTLVSLREPACPFCRQGFAEDYRRPAVGESSRCAFTIVLRLESELQLLSDCETEGEQDRLLHWLHCEAGVARVARGGDRAARRGEGGVTPEDGELAALVAQAFELRGTAYLRDAVEAIVDWHDRRWLRRHELEQGWLAWYASLENGRRS
jgi:hypothetical protein